MEIFPFGKNVCARVGLFYACNGAILPSHVLCIGGVDLEGGIQTATAATCWKCEGLHGKKFFLNRIPDGEAQLNYGVLNGVLRYRSQRILHTPLSELAERVGCYSL